MHLTIIIFLIPLYDDTIKQHMISWPWGSWPNYLLLYMVFFKCIIHETITISWLK